MTVLRIGIRCHYCSKFRPPADIRPMGTGGVKICLLCLEWHHKAMRMLAGEPPPGCQSCGIKFRDLKEFDHLGNLRMYLVVKDGIYQIHCETCSDEYIRKRADLYGDTVFGRRKGIK